MWNCRRLLLFAFAIINVLEGMYAQKPPIGRGIEIYFNFKSLRENIKMLPKTGSVGQFFSQPTIHVFKNPPTKPKYKQPENDTAFAGDLYMEFCSDLNRLFSTYFSGFDVKRLDKPWSIFTKHWSNDEIANHFGIPQDYLDDNLYSYVLVTIQRIHDSQKMASAPEDLELEPAVAKEINSLNVTDNSFRGISNVTRFMSNVGSHYIQSYATGNSLYQVLVYRKAFFNWLKQVLRGHTLNGLSKAQKVAFNSAYYNFEWSGQIKTASGNRSVEYWAVENLPYKIGDYTYKDLLHTVWKNKPMFQQLSALLQDEVILQLELRSVALLFKEPERRKKFQRIINQYFKNSG